MIKSILLILLLITTITFAQTSKDNFYYDNLNRLVGVKYANGDSLSFQYDANGNRISSQIIGGNANQSISLSTGWNTISSYINPSALNMENVFADLEELIIVKNADGQIYNPAQNINQIGNLNIAHGYMVYVTAPATLQITGTEVNPTETEINLVTGWNLISYLRNSSMPIGTALAGINNSIILVKNNAGQIYFPAYYLNTIGNMLPGQGYWIYMNSNAVLTYPGN